MAPSCGPFPARSERAERGNIEHSAILKHYEALHMAWNNLNSIESRAFRYGFCGWNVATGKGFFNKDKPADQIYNRTSAATWQAGTGN